MEVVHKSISLLVSVCVCVCINKYMHMCVCYYIYVIVLHTIWMQVIAQTWKLTCPSFHMGVEPSFINFDIFD